MQFCWLQPDQRPTAEEVHLLLSYLCAKGANEAEEDFERRWNSLCPNSGFSSHTAISHEHSSLTSSSFPLLEQFTPGDGYQSEPGDDILTVTETSRGLNFEYKWEQASADQSFGAPDPCNSLGSLNHHCQEVFYPPGGMVGGCPMENHSHPVSPIYYQANHLHAPGILPILSAHSPSVTSEYYIRIEEPVECNMDPEYSVCCYSPDYQGSSGSLLTGSADSGECMVCPSQANTVGPYWSADIHKADVYDSNDSSPAISLTMEPLLGQVSDSSPIRPWESSHYVSYKDRDGGYYYEHSPTLGMEPYLIGDGLARQHHQESWGSRSLRQALGELENPLGVLPSVGSPSQQPYRDAYLDTSQASIIGKKVTGGYYDMMGSLRKTMPSHTRHHSHSVSINMKTDGALFIRGRQDSDSEEEEEEEDIFVERYNCNTWPSKHSHNGVGQRRRASHSYRQDAYVDFHYTMPSTDIEDSWPEQHNLAFHSLPKPVDYLEPHQAKDNTACIGLAKHHPVVPSDNCNAYVYLCHESEPQVPVSVDCCHSHFVDPLTGMLVRNSSYSPSYSHSSYVTDKQIDIGSSDEIINLSPAPGGPVVAKPTSFKTEDSRDQYVELTLDHTVYKEEQEHVSKENPVIQQITNAKTEEANAIPPVGDPASELSHTADSCVDQGNSSLADILDCSDDNEDDDITDDITDVTSGIFVDESSEMNSSPAFKSLQKQVGTPDSMDSMDLPSVAGSCEGFSPLSSRPSSSPKAMDSGYDTENNESPEFVPKDHHEATISNSSMDASVKNDEALEDLEVKGEVTPLKDKEPLAQETSDHELQPLSENTPYRDSAYFSDLENEKQSRDEGGDMVHVGNGQQEELDEGAEGAAPRKDIKLEVEVGQTSSEETDSSSLLESYLTEECGSGEEELGLPLEPFDAASLTEGGLDEWPSQEEGSSLGDWAAEVVGAMEEALGALKGNCLSQIRVTEEDLKNSDQGPEEVLPVVTDNDVTEPKDELARRFSSSSPPPPPPAADVGGGADENVDTDDSDESDEELRRDSAQEESDDECHPVPVVVSDDSEAHSLRSLLKRPVLLTTASLEEELDRKRKTVSFFDDVTIYLFDQVRDQICLFSPWKEFFPAPFSRLLFLKR